MQDKACKKCGETKPFDAFSRDRSRPDGRRNACKACDVIHDANPQAKGRRAEYNRTEAGKAAFRKYRRTERGSANNRARIERVKDDPAFKRSRVRWVTKYNATPKGQAALARRLASQCYKDYQRRWCLQNVEKKRAYTRHSEQRRLAIKHSLAATLTVVQWEGALAYFGGKCAYCGAEGPLLHEHFIPLRHGGPYTATNIVPACKLCNNRKRDKMPERWCSPGVYAQIIAYFGSLGLAA